MQKQRGERRSGFPRRTGNQTGFTLVEVALAMTVLTVALMAMSASTLKMNSLRRQNRERAVAQNMVRIMSENVYSISETNLRTAKGTAQTWSELMVQSLSPGGELGNTFDVTELASKAGQPSVGTIQLILDETLSDAALGFEMGMPRDLNGDRDANDNDVTIGARILPIVITARWNGVTGDVQIRHPFYIIGY